MAKYRLLHGIHVEQTYQKATQEEVEDDRVQTVQRRGGHFILGKKTYYAGDLIESDEDLCKKFNGNHPRFQKFAKVQKTETINNPWNDLEKKTVDQLKGFAKSEGIDLGKAKTKAEVLEILQEAKEALST